MSKSAGKWRSSHLSSHNWSHTFCLYVDDTVTGSHSLSEAQKLQEEIMHILVKGDLPLLKWCANHVALLEGLPGHLRRSQFPFNFSHYDGLKNSWTFMVCFTVHISVKDKCQTSSWFCHERTSLAIISPTRDPTGCLRPVIVHYKLFIQHLWLCQLGMNCSQKMFKKHGGDYQQLPTLSNICS